MFYPLFPADFSPPLDRRSFDPWMSEVTGHGLYDEDYPSSPSLAPLLPPQAYLSLEGQNGEEAGEENVVYLWESLEKNEYAARRRTGPKYYIWSFVCVSVPFHPSCWWIYISITKKEKLKREKRQEGSLHSCITARLCLYWWALWLLIILFLCGDISLFADIFFTTLPVCFYFYQDSFSYLLHFLWW